MLFFYCYIFRVPPEVHNPPKDLVINLVMGPSSSSDYRKVNLCKSSTYNIMWYSNYEVRYMYFLYISLQGICSGHHRCTVLIGIYLQILH